MKDLIGAKKSRRISTRSRFVFLKNLIFPRFFKKIYQDLKSILRNFLAPIRSFMIKILKRSFKILKDFWRDKIMRNCVNFWQEFVLGSCLYFQTWLKWTYKFIFNFYYSEKFSYRRFKNLLVFLWYVIKIPIKFRGIL